MAGTDQTDAVEGAMKAADDAMNASASAPGSNTDMMEAYRILDGAPQLPTRGAEPDSTILNDAPEWAAPLAFTLFLIAVMLVNWPILKRLSPSLYEDFKLWWASLSDDFKRYALVATALVPSVVYFVPTSTLPDPFADIIAVTSLCLVALQINFWHG